MRKKILKCLLCLMLIIPSIFTNVEAKEIMFLPVQIHAGNGIKTEKAIIDNGEIYIAATSFSKYTRYEFDTDTNTFLVRNQNADKAFKKIVVNAETKKAAVGTKLIKLSNSFVIDGEIYLPFCQMLPILNANILKVHSNVIYIVNNKMSLAELLYDFDINDYRFNLSTEFFDSNLNALFYIGSSYLFDSVVNHRFNRLDFIFGTGNSEDYQTILKGYVKDNELFYKAYTEYNDDGELMQSINGMGEFTEWYHDVYEWFEEITKLQGDPTFLELGQLAPIIKNNFKYIESFDKEYGNMIRYVQEDLLTDNLIKDVLPGGLSFADILDGLDYMYSFLSQVEDHKNMLDAVYGISDKQSGEKLGAVTSLGNHSSEHTAAKKVYELYSGNIIPAYKEKFTDEFCKSILACFIDMNLFDLYELTVSWTGKAIDYFMPGNSEDRALLTLHTDIMNSSSRKFFNSTLETEESTNEMRLSLLLTLISSRKCYKILSETAKDSGESVGYYQTKIEKIEKMIMALYLVAENVAFDTYENFEKFAGQNKKEIKNLEVFEKQRAYTILINNLTEGWWIAHSPQASVLYSLQFNKNGKYIQKTYDPCSQCWDNLNSRLDLYGESCEWKEYDEPYEGNWSINSDFNIEIDRGGYSNLIFEFIEETEYGSARLYRPADFSHHDPFLNEPEINYVQVKGKELTTDNVRDEGAQFFENPLWLCKTYYYKNTVEQLRKEYTPYLELRDDGGFLIYENLYEGMGSYEGTFNYNEEERKLYLDVQSINFSGWLGDNVTQIVFIANEDGSLILDTDLCFSRKGAVFK